MVVSGLGVLVGSSDYLFLQLPSSFLFFLVAPFYWREERNLRLTLGFWVSLHTSFVTSLISFFWTMSGAPFDFSFWLALLYGGLAAFYGFVGVVSFLVAEGKGWAGEAFLFLTYLISPVIMLIVILLLPQKDKKSNAISVSPTSVTTSGPNLTELADLHAQGKLTDEEFSLAKKRALDQL